MDVPPPLLLRIARIGLRLSQEELADAAGVSPRTISKLESNVKIRLETLLRIKVALEGYGVRFIFKSEHRGFGLRFAPDWPESIYQSQEVE